MGKIEELSAEATNEVNQAEIIFLEAQNESA